MTIRILSVLVLFASVATAPAFLEAGEGSGAKLLEQGNEAFHNYDFEGAEQLYLTALEQDAGTQWAHHQLGRIYFARNELDKARREFGQEIELHPDSSNSFYMRGLTWAFLGSFDRAEEDFRAFVEMSPASEAGPNDLAYVLFVQNKFEEAEDILQDLYQRLPHSFLASQGLAAVYIEMGEPEKAEPFARKALEYAENMDVEMFRMYYPSLQPEHAQKGLETIQKGIRHNFNLVASLQGKPFEIDEDTPAIVKPYFKTASAGMYGAVFLAASCSADYQHTDECLPWTSITSPASGSWRRSNFTVSVNDTAPSGTTFSTCWYQINSGGWNQRTCPDGSVSVSAGSTGDCTTQGANTCSVYADACTTGFGCGSGDTRSFGIDYTNPSVGQIFPSTATKGQAVTLSASVSDSHSGILDCFLYVNGSFQGSMTVSGGSASRSHTFTTAGSHTAYAWCSDGASNSAQGTTQTISVADPCVRSDPTVSLNPSSQSGNPGQTLQYTATITNNDTADCGSTSFSFAGNDFTTNISSTTVSPTSATISPGSNAQTTLSATSSASASPGDYTVYVDVTSANHSGTSWGSATYTVNPTLSASVSSNPTSGTTSTNFQITVSVGGTATGDIQLQLFCDGVTSNTALFSTTTNPYTFATPCSYSSPGTKNPRVDVFRQGLSTSPTGSISVNATPDLFVQSITPSTTTPQIGQTVSYTVVVNNQGESASTTGFLGGYLPANVPSNSCTGGGATFDWESLGTIAAGTTASFTITKSGGFDTAGTQSVTMFVDDMCDVTESNEGNNKSSKSVSVQADTTSPIVTVVPSPSSVTTTWQNVNASTSITCTDSGSGCQSSGNWKWLTRGTAISNCSTLPLTDYTGTYAGSFAITNHVWMCATALDVAGNRGYSAPVEFKVDKIPPYR